MVNKWSFITQILGARCALCGTVADGLCESCRRALPINRHACPVCALPLTTSVPRHTHCAACQHRRPAFELTVAPLLYRTPVDDLIAGLKYHHRLHLAATLAECLSDAVLAERQDSNRPWPEVAIPVPMHPQHLRARGFNQATELARLVARRLGMVISTDLLRRTGPARHQRGLRRRDRLRIAGTEFVATTNCPRHVAIIDDVVTTGATVESVSRTLRASGADCIEVWSVARTPP